MRAPYIKKGPASHYAGPGQTIREVGNGTGNGCLISIQNNDDGSMTLHVYAIDNVTVNVAEAQETA